MNHIKTSRLVLRRPVAEDVHALAEPAFLPEVPPAVEIGFGFETTVFAHGQAVEVHSISRVEFDR